MQYVALLRGINVGGNKKVPMARLKNCLEQANFTQVKTLLNSGNVIFETSENNEQKVTEKLETLLEKEFGWHIPLMVRNSNEIQALIKKDPFKNIKLTESVRRYVTLLKDPIAREVSEIELIEPLLVTDREVCYVIDIRDTATVKAMEKTEKAYQQTITTTRNWNTVVKISALMK